MSVVPDAAGFLPSSTSPLSTAEPDTNTFYRYAQKGEVDYFMNNPTRGWAYILNMAGQLQDAELLEQTLNNLQFNVLNIQKDKIRDVKMAKDIIKQTPEFFNETEDCIFIAILFTVSQNKDCKLETAWKNLVEYNTPKSNISPLVSKPKILLLQEYTDPPIIVSKGTTRNDHHSEISNDNARCLPTHSDVLLVHGFGPHYIKSFCEEISNDDDDLVSMLTKVNAKVIQENLKKIDNREQKLPFYTSMLTLNVKFPKKKAHININKDGIEKRLEEVLNKKNILADDAAIFLAKLTQMSIDCPADEVIKTLQQRSQQEQQKMQIAKK